MSTRAFPNPFCRLIATPLWRSDLTTRSAMCVGLHGVIHGRTPFSILLTIWSVIQRTYARPSPPLDVRPLFMAHLRFLSRHRRTMSARGSEPAAVRSDSGRGSCLSSNSGGCCAAASKRSCSSPIAIWKFAVVPLKSVTGTSMRISTRWRRNISDPKLSRTNNRAKCALCTRSKLNA
jgi:hypothetical protein